jgi:hypothetical protein
LRKTHIKADNGMDEKRRYQRFPCTLKMDFEYYEGDPDEIDTETTVPIKGKGVILDISIGGVFFVTNSRVGINVPIDLKFSTKRQSYNIRGMVIRTGLLKNNPSEVAMRFANTKAKGDSYIAVEFNTLIDGLNAGDM